MAEYNDFEAFVIVTRRKIPCAWMVNY